MRRGYQGGYSLWVDEEDNTSQKFYQGATGTRRGRKQRSGADGQSIPTAVQGFESGYNMNASSLETREQYQMGRPNQEAMGRFYVEDGGNSVWVLIWPTVVFKTSTWFVLGWFVFLPKIMGVWCCRMITHVDITFWVGAFLIGR